MIVKKDVKITCKTLEKGVIQKVGYTMVTTDDKNQSTPSSDTISKADMIKIMEGTPKPTVVTSPKGTEVKIINGKTGKYLRSDGNQDESDDLSDVVDCK